MSCLTTHSQAETRLMLRKILKKWSRHLGELPRDYITYDLETCGIDRTEDLIVELGHCIVIDGVSESYHSHVIDWTNTDGIDQDWLKFKLKNCAEHMAKSGRTYHMNYERMRREGSPPDVVLQEYKDLFDEARDANILIVGHNAVQFDNPFFEVAVNEWLAADDWTFPELVFDTAAVVKATIVQMPPLKGESLQQYFFRVLDRPAPGVRYNLDTFCVERFGLLDKYPGLQISDAHTAGFDAMLTHLLLEEFRELGDLSQQLA